MDALALLAEARAAGLRLEVDGDRLLVRGPKAAEPIVHRLRDAETAIVRLLTTPEITLDPDTVREVLLGPDAADPHTVACLRFDVLEAVREFEAAIQSGVLPPRRLIHGRPLADWLCLHDVARLLSARSAR